MKLQTVVVILPGVTEDGTPNTTRIEAYYTGSAYGTGVAPNKAFVYDASYVKLRELAVSYNFLNQWLKKLNYLIFLLAS
jgi:hypothetical protein